LTYSPFGLRWPLSGVGRIAVAVGVVAVLLCLGVANILARATWTGLEDGVLWTLRSEGVIADEVAAGSGAARAGVRPGDVLLAIDGRPVDSLEDVIAARHAGRRDSRLTYTILRLDTREHRQVALQPVPDGNRGLYFVLAAVAIFTLLVGASVRLRRPDDQATLHFFWLCVAFFGVAAFSPSGRFDRLDWFFYWADVAALLVLPPLFVHFALIFPERSPGWLRRDGGRRLLPLLYVPALFLGATRVALLGGESIRGPMFSVALETLERLELIYLAIGLMSGLALTTRALRRVRSVTARRQLRWIVWGTALGTLPFAFGYALPFSLGLDPWPAMELTAVLLILVPLAFASAIIRYRLMDVEVIIKRGLVYAAAIAAILIIYAILLQVATEIFLDGTERHNSIIAMLATLVVVLLARPVKDTIQNALDRVYYRDRYDYRRALVGFARDLNRDLDIHRLSERLVARVMETFVVNRMALMLAPLGGHEGGDFVPIAASGFDGPGPPPPLNRDGGIGTRLQAGHTVALDDPVTVRRFAAEEVTFWRDRGIHYFVPCVSKEGTIAVMALGHRPSMEPLSSEDMALLTAVAAQVATALENGRLYRQLRLKADEVERMREFSENILESLNDGLLVLDHDDRVVRWNRRLEELSSLSRAEAVGRRLEDVFEPAFVGTLREARGDSAAGATLYKVPLISGADRKMRRLVNVAAAPLRRPDGATAGTIVIVEDISARVQLEEQLQISEKMASIGLLAAGVAHEVNTPLTGISSFTQMLLENASPDDPRTPILEKIERQTFRAAKIVNGLLNLARPAQVDSGPVDLNAVINDVLSLLEHQFRTNRIQVRKELCSPPPIVQAIEYKFQQVFLNLFMNARDAMPRGGWLSIASRLENGVATVEVGDTGAGIPSEHLSRIYDPFFTTKSIGQGTGLGLSITYGIVQEHDGSITCESVPGQGTRFKLTLPLATAVMDRPSEVAN
jgi:two-component system, NtrC family, sensor kinase